MNFKKISHFFQKNINYLILITLSLIIFSITFGSSLLEMLRLINIKNDLNDQIAQGEELSSQLDEEIAQIGTQSYIERIARQYLELYYPNEQIVIPVENTYKSTNENQPNPENPSNIQNEESPVDQTQEEPNEEVIEETESTQQEVVEEPTENQESLEPNE